MGDTNPRRVTLKLLGGCYLLVEGKLVQGVPANFFRIAAYLILTNPDQVQPRSRLSTLLWPQADEGKAAANMRQAVARIRSLQEEHRFHLITANFSTLHLEPIEDMYCDLLEFIRASQLELSPLQLCRLYDGELLSDLGSGSEDFEDWLSSQRNELLLQAVDGIARGIQPDSPLDHADRATCARRLLELDPYREDALCVLMEEAAERRHFGRVSQLYTSMRTMLADELGVEPSAETRAFYNNLMQNPR
ncbi:MAG: hypothetical protein EOO82_00295 [Oxalobacteraceae bacterium]|jgi:DNA-binding SARP family transcriptional activator|nr:MAG: hypothetical protein EOO82_00295 [Oxalobacteraceae bacterium]